MRTKKIAGRAGAAAAAVLLLAVCALPAAAQDELARRGSYIYTQDGKDHLEDHGTIRYEMGYACAIATVLFLMMLLSNMAIQRLLRKVGE